MDDFKKTELGLIPQDWVVIPAEKYCQSVRDGTHDSPAKSKQGKYLITSRHLKEYDLDFANAYLISESDFEEINRRSKVDRWDVLLGMIGTVGEVYLVKDENIDFAIKNIGLFKNNGDEVRGRWLKYYLSSPYAKEYLNISKAGTTQEYVTLGALRNFPIVLPSNQTEQKKIIAFLDCLSEKIELNHQMNKTLEAMAQALFKKWFVDFEFPDNNGKPYKSNGGKMIGSHLGNLPDGWAVSNLGAMGVFKNGINYLRNEEGDTDFSIVNVRDITNNKILLKDSLDKIRLNFSKAKDYLLQEKDVLIARSASPGEISLVLGDLEKVIYSGFSIRYRLNNTLNYLYIFHILQGLKRNLQSYSVGTGLQSVNQETLKGMKVIAPPEEVITKYNMICIQILDKILNNLLQNKELSQIRDSLLPRLMSGKIRVAAK